MSFIKKNTPPIFKRLYHEAKWIITRIMVKIKYGATAKWQKGYYSQFGQDKFIEDYLINELNIYFEYLIDVGSHNPIDNNNSYYFENTHKTICIDPLYTKDDYKVRPNTVFHQLAININKGIGVFYKVNKIQGWEDQMSSFNKPEAHFKATELKVMVDRLENVIEMTIDERTKFGLLIDVEGLEDIVLETLNIKRFRPVFILVETAVCNFKLKDELISNGYKYFARCGPCDDLFIDKVL
jgi:hypothetical protein